MSNHIDHIEISNFKSIRHQKIEGCKRINVFIGYPNVGKSAILEAISSLSYFKKEFLESFNKLCRVKHANELFYEANIKESATINTGKGRAKLTYVSESEFYSNLEIYSNTSSEFITKDGIVNTNWENLRDIRYKENNNEFISEVSNYTHFLGENLKIADGLPLVKKYVFNGDFNDDKTNALHLFSPHGENLVDVVQANKELRKEVAELFKSYNLELVIDPSTNSIRGLKRLDEGVFFQIPFYQMADTLQRLIFHQAAIMSNENTVLLFEEPEAHMFPPYISKFTGDIIYEKDNGNQYFISTHSPFVMNDFLEDARDELSIYLVGYKNGETVIKRLSDEELHEVYQYGVDLFFNIESYLD